MSFDLQKLVDALNRQTFVSAKVLQHLYLKEQRKESDKVPVTYRATYVTLAGASTTIVNVLNRNPARAGFSVSNTSTTTVLYNQNDFHGGTAVTEFKRAATNKTSDFGVLTGGKTISISASGALWVVNTGTNPVNLNIIENVYMDRHPSPVPGTAGDQMVGRRDVGEEIQHLVGEFRELV